MDILEKLQQLNDDNLIMVVNMVDALLANQLKGKIKKKRGTAKNLNINGKKVKGLVTSIPEKEENDEDDEWEIKPNKKKGLRPNKFLKMPEFNLDREDQGYLPKSRVPRRPPIEKVTVVCDKCNSSFKISESLLPPAGSRMYCDKCNLRKAGRN